MTESAEDQSTAGAMLCVSCEYDLRGLAAEARCPECGADVKRSRQHHEALLAGGEPPLWMSLPAWLRKMGIGCGLALGSGVALTVAMAVWSFPLMGAPMQFVGIALAIGSDGLRTAALWLLGTREPAARVGVRSARLIRIGAVLQALALARTFLWNPPVFAIHRYIAITETVLMAAVTALVWARSSPGATIALARCDASSPKYLRWLLPVFMVVQVIFFSGIPMARGGGWMVKPQAIVGETFALGSLPLELIKGAKTELMLRFWAPALAVTLLALATLAAMSAIFFREASVSAADWKGSPGDD